MSDWTKESAEWITQPLTHTTQLEDYKDRGLKWLREWVDVTLDSIKAQKDVAMKIGIGFEFDADTNAHQGAMLSIQFGDREPTFFRPEELKIMILFLRHEFDDASDDTREFFSVEGLIACFEEAIGESEKFSTKATRQ
jgi:hypothetical protein